MSLSPDTMMDLMAYGDGELDAEGRLRVEALLANNEEARRVVDALGALGDHVREAILHREQRGGGELADLVMARLDRMSGQAQVVPLRARRGRVRAVFGVGVAGAFAVAAAYALMVRTAVDTLVEPSSPGIAAVAEGQGVEVEQLDTPDRAVSVLYVPAVNAAANANASSVVIWIADDTASGDK